MNQNTEDLDAIVSDARELHRAGDLQGANAGYESVLSLEPGHGEALHLKGILHGQRGDLTVALRFLDRAVEAAPTDPGVIGNRAKIKLDLGDVSGAVVDYRASLTHAPDNPDTHFNLAGALAVAGQTEEAVGHLESACEQDPAHARALANLGNLYRLLGRLKESREVLARAISVSPEDAKVQHSLGATLMDGRDYRGAADRFRQALTLDKGFVRAATQLFFAGLHACDWRERDGLVSNFGRLIDSGNELTSELSPLVALFLPAAQSKLNVVSSARAGTLETPAVLSGEPPHEKAKLHVAYISADLGQHPVGYLTADLFHRHDRSKFDVSVFILAAPDGGDVQKMIHKGVDTVIDVSRLSAGQAADRVREAGVDVLVDLGGFTRGARPEILGYRAAPLQIGWLGYCGSAGGLNDVLLLDEAVLPPGSASQFPEALACLPGSFMPLNNFAAASEADDTRGDHGLPDDGFVFCAFNTPTKIDPETFSCWMDILKQVPGSVLWLRDHVALTTQNLCAAAEQHGVDPARLIFALPLPDMGDHLTRHRHADLFLDSFIYGAHSTAADAIAMGLPVLTRAGEAMPARVGASLCRDYGLSALVVDTSRAYIETAVRLAGDREQLEKHRMALAENLPVTRDSQAFVRKLEDAYTKLWQAKLTNELAPGRVIDLTGAHNQET